MRASHANEWAQFVPELNRIIDARVKAALEAYDRGQREYTQQAIRGSVSMGHQTGFNDDDPEALGAAADPGDLEYAARIDHVHPGPMMQTDGVDDGYAHTVNCEGFTTDLTAGVFTLTSAFALDNYLDYSSSSTVNGWSSFDSKVIYYQKVGALVFVNFAIDGTSDNATTNFTVPYASLDIGLGSTFSTNVYDNGTAQTIPGAARIGQNSDVVNLYLDSAGNTFTASNRKVVTGGIWYWTDA